VRWMPSLPKRVLMFVANSPSFAISYDPFATGNENLHSRSPRAVYYCGFPPHVADADSPTCMFAEFSSKWRTGFSHLRGGSYNRTVVHEPDLFNVGCWCASGRRKVARVARKFSTATSVEVSRAAASAWVLKVAAA
jgi:hypothetical protein